MQSSLEISLRPERRLFLSQSMRQGLLLLEMPLLELKKYLESEIEQNPLLEWKEVIKNDEKNYYSTNSYSTSHNYELEKIPKKESVFEGLFQQIHEVFPDPKERKLAEHFLENIDEKGFLTSSDEALEKETEAEKTKIEKVRQKIQHLDPLGICSRSLQEYLLLQLQEQKKENSLAYKIVQDHFSALTHYHFSKIEKQLKMSHLDLLHLLQKDLRPLSLSPLTPSSQQAPSISPDFFLYKEGNRWIYRYNQTISLSLQASYLRALTSVQKEEKIQVRSFLNRAKLIMKGLDARRRSLKKIAFYLLKKQRSFFEEKENLEPLSILQMASDLQLNPSTAARAIRHKYVACPAGILPLRSFFSSSLSTSEGGVVSKKKVLQLLKKWILEEDKEKPLTDEALFHLMEKAHIRCARRTIVKYRKELSIGSASKRKRLFYLK